MFIISIIFIIVIVVFVVLLLPGGLVVPSLGRGSSTERRIRIREFLVGIRVGSLAPKALAEVGVPIILDLVVGAAGKATGDEGPPVAEESVEPDD